MFAVIESDEHPKSIFCGLQIKREKRIRLWSSMTKNAVRTYVGLVNLVINVNSR
jgi:hypothetical protein